MAMRKVNVWMLCVLVVMFVSNVVAGTWYVAIDSDSDGPGTEWGNAFHEIQGGIDAASDGDTILVGDGVYEVGGRAVTGGLLNRVVIDKEITVKSLDGAESTIIKGAGPLGFGAVRCVSLGTNAVLSGFTLTNGFTRGNFGDESDEYLKGGGVWCAPSAVVSNCVISGCEARYGGGVAGGTLYSCELLGNEAEKSGGGSFESSLHSCLLTENSANNGGGVFGGAVYNCTVVGNSALDGGGVYDGTLYNSIIWANTANGGGSNPNRYSCGYSYSTCSDFQDSWEFVNGNISNAPSFNDPASGDYRLQHDSPCIGAGSNQYVSAETDLVGIPRILDGSVDMGAYELLEMHYVDINSANPVAPYASWATAATSIQDAVDVAVDKARVLVADGVYETGVRDFHGDCRVVIDKEITIESVNGVDKAIIKGAGPDGPGAIRCVYVGTNAMLTGFTLTNGATFSSGYEADVSGGGALCESSSVVSNCMISGNSAEFLGGGIHGGMLKNCSVVNNEAGRTGGGVHGSTLYSCLVANNRSWRGGGAYESTLDVCTVVDNSVTENGDETLGDGGGVYRCNLRGTIVWYNSADGTGNDIFEGSSQWVCSPDVASGDGITDMPKFIDRQNGNYRLQYGSPCIDNTLMWYDESALDLDGNPRTWGSLPDMGAYEYDMALTDSDGDTLTDSHERIAGTNPVDGDSVFCISQIETVSGVMISWTPIEGRTYSVYWTEELTSTAVFELLASGLTDPQGSYTDSTHNSKTRGFYRITVEEQ